MRTHRLRKPGLRSGASPLSTHHISPGGPLPVDDGRILASIDYGMHAFRRSPAPVRVMVPLVQMGGEPIREVWCGAEPVEAALRDGPVSLASSGPVAFGVAEAPAGDGPGLEAAARHLYGDILSALARSDHPHPLRFWNVFPRINELDRGLERYRWFCRGRADAFDRQYGEGFERTLCAASAVGSGTGSLLVYFLASSEPGIQVENPRQVSAFAYPREYGPRSPSFARATRCPASCGDRLLLSGTASIVGHRTVHGGDVVGQLRETLRNLERLTEGRPCLQLKVFVRHARDLPTVRRELSRRLDPKIPVLYLRADICRSDLLLEIEGVSSQVVAVAGNW